MHICTLILLPLTVRSELYYHQYLALLSKLHFTFGPWITFANTEINFTFIYILALKSLTFCSPCMYLTL